MGSSGSGGVDGGLPAVLQNPQVQRQLQGPASRDQLARLMSGAMPAPAPVRWGENPSAGGGAIGLPGDPVIAAKIAQAMQQQGGAQKTNFGGAGFDFTDPRYTSRAAEGGGPSAARPDMSAMLASRQAQPPAPPPLPYGIPFPR